VSCTTISVHHTFQICTDIPVELGAIGLEKGNFINTNFETIAIPTFNNKLKLRVQPISFSKQSFKAFTNANKLARKVVLNYSDSLKVKPEYVLLEFVDRVSIISVLNNSKNTGVRLYLEKILMMNIITYFSCFITITFCVFFFTFFSAPA
jgi:hypothetical protein